MHAHYWRLDYNIKYKNDVYIIILIIIYMTIQYDLHIEMSRIRTCIIL